MLNVEHLGKVVYIDDPTFSGRCKVQVFGLFDDLDIDHIPWFTPMNQTVFSSYGAGCISVPQVGDIVRVRFINEDYYSGEYTSIQNLDPELINEIKDDYIGTHVLLYDCEKDLVILYQPLSGLKLYLNGSHIKIDADGTIQAKHKNNTNVIEVKDDNINITTVGLDNNGTSGTINISAGKVINLTAPTVNIKADDINMGNNARHPAVKGDKLVNVLCQIRDELMTKYPQYASAMMGRTFEEILSSTEKNT